MTGKELIVCITLVVIICFIIAALLGTLRECKQAEDDIDRLEKQKEASLKKLREENVKLCKECIVLRHGAGKGGRRWAEGTEREDLTEGTGTGTTEPGPAGS